jgi:hypothetical protein
VKAARWQVLVSIIFFGAVCFSGCAFGKFGKANSDYFNVNVPSGLSGQNKASVLKTLGVPNTTMVEGGTDYWVYNNKNGFFIALYGKTTASDLVLEFKNDQVANAYLVDKGSSVGIFAAPGSVAQ